MHLFLASQSPRRRELLNQIGVVFEPLEVSIDETPAMDESPLDYVRRVAREKAGAGLLQVAAVQMPRACCVCCPGVPIG